MLIDLNLKQAAIQLAAIYNISQKEALKYLEEIMDIFLQSVDENDESRTHTFTLELPSKSFFSEIQDLAAYSTSILVLSIWAEFRADSEKFEDFKYKVCWAWPYSLFPKSTPLDDSKSASIAQTYSCLKQLYQYIQLDLD